MALLPANPGEALWIGAAAGKNHYNVGIGGPAGGTDHDDYSQSQIEDGFEQDPEFCLNSDGDAQFRMYVENGRTSNNTKYPRSELREFRPDGTTRADWNSGSGTHYMKGRSRIDTAPSAKPWVVFFQCHDASSDLARVQLENGSIVCRRTPPGGDEIRTVLRTGYSFGTWIAWEMRFVSGTMTILLDGQTVLTASGMGTTGCYFKTGCYNQVSTASDGGGAAAGEYCQVTMERGSLVTWHTGYANPSTPVFTGSADSGGGPGGGDGTPDVQAPTVPQNPIAVRSNETTLNLSWEPSTDNVGVALYNVYRYTADGTGGAGGETGSPTGGSGGPLTDREDVTYNNGTVSSTYHIYADDLDWDQRVGILVYADGSGEAGLNDTSDDYLMAGTDGLIAVAKRHNMVLVTPLAPGNGCTDGDGTCWYLGSFNGVTRAQKTEWLDDLIQTQVLALYDIDVTRAVISGFSSGAENTMGLYGPLYAASWMEDGLLLAISYGSSPDQYGVTDTYTAGFRANVAAVWDVYADDETTAVADSLEGYDWYDADGFATIERTVRSGGQHDRPGEFGGLVDEYVSQYVAAASTGGSAGTEFTVGNTTGGASETTSSADKMVASRFTAGSSGTLTGGRARAWLSATGSTSSRMLVYADSSSAPGALLATSDQITISTTSESVRSYQFTGSAQIALTAGTAYWVAVAWDDPGTPSITYSRGDTSSTRRERSDITYGTFPNPWGTSTGTFSGPIDAWLIAVTGTSGGGGTTTESFGKLTDGSSSTSSSTDKIALSSFTATDTGTLTAGHARAWLSSAGSTGTKMVVYSNSAGSPSALLATSDETTITATSEGVRDYTFTGGQQIAIESGTTYWIGLAWDDPGAISLTYSRDATSNQRVESSTFTYPTMPDPITVTTGFAGPIDVYLDVSVSSGSGAGYTLIGTTTSTAYVDTNLTSGTEYGYVVTAEDAAGNESGQSSAFSGTPGPPDLVAPSVPTDLAVTPGDGRLTITWTASTDDDSGVLRYTVYFGGVSVATVAAGDTLATAVVLVGLVNGTEYSVTVSATDGSLNTSAQSSPVLATPSAPAIGGTALLPSALVDGKLEVSAAFGADLSADESTWTWVDITADVRDDPGITTSLGRNDESSTSNPAQMTLVLDNTSGDYSLGVGSARYPYIRRNTPIRLRIDPGSGGGRVVLQGGADGWTPGWHITGNVPVVTLSVSGTLRRLAQGSAPLQSAYRRVMTALSSVKAYWPMEEGRDATFAYPVRGGTPFAFTGGSPNWASSTEFDCSDALPTMGDGYGQAAVTAYTNTGSNQVRCLLAIPDSGLTSGTVLMHVSTTGTIHRWDITYEVNAGFPVIGLYVYNASDGSRYSDSLVQFTGLNGFTGRMSLALTQSGSNISWQISLTPAIPGAVAEFVNGTVTGRTVGIVERFELNPHNADIGATIGHITVENAVTSLFTDNDALIAHFGDTVTGPVSGRLKRLCDENDVPLAFYDHAGSSLGVLDKMGPQLVAPLLDLLHECETVDQGQLWDGRAAGLQYTTRRRREVGTVKLTIDASAGQLAEPFAPVDDDQRDRNKVTVTRLHGASYTHEDVTGPKGTAAIGIYDDAVTVNCMADDSTVDFAEWFVRLGTVAGYRYPTVTINLAGAPELAAAVLDIVPGERINVTNLNTALAQFTGSTVSLIVEGIAHEVSRFSWQVTFRCSPYGPWAAGIENNPVAEEDPDVPAPATTLSPGLLRVYPPGRITPGSHGRPRFPFML